MPFDWRQHANIPVNKDKMIKTIDLAFKLNQKKVVIIAHSLGALMTYATLMKNTNQKK